MMDKVTYKDRRWRVQLAVWDLRGPYGPKDRCQLNFSVTVLPSTANRFTAFSRGHSVYYGPSLSEAIKLMQKFIPNKFPVLPKTWQRYIMEAM